MGMSEHRPDPEFVEYMEDQVNNAFLSAATVMQMERVFIDQREKYEARLQAAREQEGGEVAAWRMTFTDENGVPCREVFWEQRHLDSHYEHNTKKRSLDCTVTPLYTHPPQSQGVPEGWKHEIIEAPDLIPRRPASDEPGVLAEYEESDREWFENNSELVEALLTNSEKIRALLSTPAAPQADSFQNRVAPWMQECFGPEISADRTERNHRFLEEALELVQSLGCTSDEAHQLVDYVFGREVGEPFQEVGGVRVTLAALCLANNLDQDDCAELELARITQPQTVKKIREKQKRKPSMSPLPGVYPERPQPPEQGDGV